MKKLVLIIIVSFSLLLNLSAQNAIKKVMLEEFTTTLCGFCPPRSYAINEWQENHLNNSIVVTIHEGFGRDSMSNPLTLDIYNALKPPSGTGFAPAIMIDRGYYPYMYPNEECPYITTNGFDTIALRISNAIPVVAVNIDGNYNQTNRTINATVSVNFTQSIIPADYRISLIVVEDSVVGSGSGWDQKCYDGNFANQHYPGQYNPSTLYISNYPHRKVLRAAMLGNWGVAGVIPTSPVIGTVYSTNASYVVPTRFNTNRIYLVAYVARYSSSKIEKYILNANEIKLSSNFTTNIEENQTKKSAYINNIFPSPSSGGNIYFDYFLTQNSKVTINIVNAFGENIKCLVSNQNYTAGAHQTMFNTKNFAKGLYFVNLKCNNENYVQKFIIN